MLCQVRKRPVLGLQVVEDGTDLFFRLLVDLEVVVRLQAVLHRLSVLAHQDDRGGVGRLYGQERAPSRVLESSAS